MRKLLLLASTFAFLALSSFSQIEYEDLVVSYAEGKYEKCAAKAYKYMNSDKHKKDPVPYVYASMASLRMSQDPELLEKYPKSFKDAINYAAKYRKKDPNGEKYIDFIDHFEELKKIVIEECENYLLTDDDAKFDKGVSKSYGFVKKTSDFDPNDAGIMLLKGVLELMSNNKTAAKVTLEEADPMITESLAKFDDLTEMEQYSIRMAIMYHARHSMSKQNKEEAMMWLDRGKEYFYNQHPDYKRTYSTTYKDLYDKVKAS